MESKTTMANFNPNDVRQNESLRSLSVWVAVAIALCFVGWGGFSLYRTTAAFADLYATLNAHPQGIAGFALQNFKWVYPSIFGSAAAFIITKQFLVRDKWPSLGTTIAAVAVIAVVQYGLVVALYQPILGLGK